MSYPDAIGSFVDQTARLVKAERERDELRATLFRVERAAHDHPYCIGECACAVQAVDAALEEAS